MKCVMQAARQVCFHLEILVAIVIPHIDVISKRSILSYVPKSDDWKVRYTRVVVDSVNIIFGQI